MTPGAAPPTPALELRGVRKSFGAVAALGGVDLRLMPGEVLALLGDNGAGKSTLVKIVAGYHHPDAGEIRLDGRAVRFAGPKAAREAGIETIYQDLALFDNLDVAANVFAGQELVRGGWGRWLGLADRRLMGERAAGLLAGLGVDVRDPGVRVAALSGGQRQGVAIAKAVLWGRRIVIMDEPTAALGVRETGRVLDLIRDLEARGVAVVLVMHNIDQVLDVARRAVVLRRGAVRGDIPFARTDRDELRERIVRLML